MRIPARTSTHRRAAAAVAALSLLLFTRCASAPAAVEDHAPDWIVVAGERFPIGTRVVTWQEEGGYSAYLRGKHFDQSEPPDGKPRYSRRPWTKGEPAGVDAPAADLDLDQLRRIVHQFVVHYDVCGTSRQCFKVLQDVRTLSVHFLLDVDGTIYQTLDLREKAWHATIANDFSVGVEIAHPGAWPQPMNADMRRWYERDDDGWYMKLPAWMTETGIRTKDFVARPDRREIVSGAVQGKTYHQLDFTRQQYDALARLVAGLNRALPRIRIDAPRDANGQVVPHVLEAERLRAFDGVVGHFHVQENKQDPGPAFQWERVFDEARELRYRASAASRDLTAAATR